MAAEKRAGGDISAEVSRRAFLRSAGVCAAGFAGLSALSSVGGGRALAALMGDGADSPVGPLVRDPAGVLDLPRGFSYRVISRWGDEMDDGLLVPALADGMAAFVDPSDGRRTVLVRNHENRSKPASLGPFGAGYERLGRVDRESLYDWGHGRTPALGGTTNIVYDTRRGEVEGQFLPLGGTVRNCAGGPTPWGSWLTCEEDVSTPDEIHERSHGWVFEVPAVSEVGLAEPRAIEAMGRFNHEAVAVDPATSIVYLTEDRGDGLLYRFVPEVRGEMGSGGRLEALAVKGERSRDLRNWGDGPSLGVGERLEVEWVELTGIDAPEDDLRLRGFGEAGAARFARLEGAAWADREAYFICTTGGARRKGQVFRYRPSPAEGTEGESERPGSLELMIEPNDASVLNMPDNCCVAPWGDLVVCEDNGTDSTRLLGVTRSGRAYRMARNAVSDSEFAGVCFSPDGTTLFVNIQADGLTLAVGGPWPG